jgi:S-adenosyl-L-methionine hydrolase (adenosine-forming)
MIALFTDFGLHGPYTGQMKAVLHQMAPGIPIIDLFADAPVGNPKASAYLLAAYAAWFPVRTVFLCVVDPGVGGTRPSGERLLDHLVGAYDQHRGHVAPQAPSRF